LDHQRTVVEGLAMRLKSTSLVVAVILSFGAASMAQAQVSPSPTGPPKFLNIAHQELKPGAGGPYDASQAAIATSYNRENIPIYWMELDSFTGPSEALYLEFFDSSEALDKAAEVMEKALIAHPEIAQMQDHLLQENTSGAETVLAVRRDDMGYRVNTIDMAKMRYLRISTIFVHPGYERAFLQAEWTLSGAYEKVNAQTPWVVYEVNAGLPAPTFIVLMPMRSLEDLDQSLATDSALHKPENESVEENLQELARVAYGNVDTHLYRVNQKASRVSKEFAAGDPQFWSVPPSAEPEAGAAKAPRPAPRKAAPKE
jgi:hypothetical protein